MYKLLLIWANLHDKVVDAKNDSIHNKGPEERAPWSKILFSFGKPAKSFSKFFFDKKKHHLYTVEPKPRYNQGKPSLHNISEYLTHERCCVVVSSNILGFQIGKICRYPQMRQSTNLAKAVLRQCHDPRYLAASPKPSPCTLLFITSWGRKRILPGGVFIVHGGHIGRGLIYSDFGTIMVTVIW